jgi:methionyl-tRNA formyltransferase
LRVVFAGTPHFAVQALAALHGAGHDIALVLTQPDRPSGRGLRLAASPVGLWAEDHGLRVAKPSSLREEGAQESLRSAAPDVMVVGAYGLILPPAVLAIPVRGCLNIHASLLPRWRGAAPVQRALLAGDVETGISIMQMEAGLDTGPVLSEIRTPILASDTAGILTDRLSALGASAIVEALANPDRLISRPQDSSKATYASKVGKADTRIDWSWPAAAVDRQVRAFNPSPGAETSLLGEPLKVWRAVPAEGSESPGKVLQSRNNRLVIACKVGALELLEIQRPGGRRMAASEFLRGVALAEGQELGQKPLASP